MRTRSVALLAVTLLTACGAEFGPGIPECGRLEISVAPVTIVQAQAVPTAEFGPCINELKPGWDYVAQEAKSGIATFWIDSDRMGEQFLTVSLLPACEVGAALPAPSPLEGVSRFVDIRAETGGVPITVIPVTARVQEYAESVLERLRDVQLEGRAVVASVAPPDAAASLLVERALARGEAVLVLDDREVATGTVELRLPGEEPRAGLLLDVALEEIEDGLSRPVYQGSWYHLFPGGCIVYEIDASGFGSETLASDIDAALGFHSLAQLRNGAREFGYEI